MENKEKTSTGLSIPTHIPSLKLIVHTDAINLVSEAIKNFKSNETGSIGNKTSSILNIYRKDNIINDITPERLCSDLFFTRQKAVYAENKTESENAGYSKADWNIMRHITPFIDNVQVGSNGNISNPQWFNQPKKIKVVGMSGVLQTDWADGTLNDETYKQEVKKRMLPVLEQIAEISLKNPEKITFAMPAIGCGVWGKFGNITELKNIVWTALQECVQHINTIYPAHCIGNVKFFGLKLDPIKIGEVDVSCDNTFNFVPSDAGDNEIIVGMAGDPYAPLGSDVFKSGAGGGTGEKFVTHTNLGEILYGIDGRVPLYGIKDTVPANEDDREKLANLYNAHYILNNSKATYSKPKEYKKDKFYWTPKNGEEIEITDLKTLNGKGTITSVHIGRTHREEGTFEDGILKQGTVEIKYQDGTTETHKGTFEDGILKQGTVTIMHPDKTTETLTGTFEGGILTKGVAEIKYQDGTTETLTGTFEGGKLNGEGFIEYNYVNCIETQKGTFEGGMLKGVVEIKYQDGTSKKMDGEFTNEELHNGIIVCKHENQNILTLTRFVNGSDVNTSTPETATQNLKTLLEYAQKNTLESPQELPDDINGKKLNDLEVNIVGDTISFHNLAENQWVLDDLKLLLGENVKFYQLGNDKEVLNFKTNAVLSGEDSTKLLEFVELESKHENPPKNTTENINQYTQTIDPVKIEDKNTSLYTINENPNSAVRIQNKDTGEIWQHKEIISQMSKVLKNAISDTKKKHKGTDLLDNKDFIKHVIAFAQQNNGVGNVGVEKWKLETKFETEEEFKIATALSSAYQRSAEKIGFFSGRTEGKLKNPLVAQRLFRIPKECTEDIVGGAFENKGMGR